MPIQGTHSAHRKRRKHDELRRRILAGVAALDRGDYTEVDDADLDAYLDSLAESESHMVQGQP